MPDIPNPPYTTIVCLFTIPTCVAIFLVCTVLGFMPIYLPLTLLLITALAASIAGGLTIYRVLTNHE